MIVLGIHQHPSLTQERYEEVVRRLTGKERIEAPSDFFPAHTYYSEHGRLT